MNASRSRNPGRRSLGLHLLLVPFLLLVPTNAVAHEGEAPSVAADPTEMTMPDELRAILEELYQETEPTLDARASIDGSIQNLALDSYHEAMSKGLYTMALGQLARAKALSDLVEFGLRYNQTENLTERMRLNLAAVAQRLQDATQTLRAATLTLPDDELTWPIAWTEFEYRLFAGLVTAQSYYFVEHTEQLLHALKSRDSFTFVREAYIDTAGVEMNSRFLLKVFALDMDGPAGSPKVSWSQVDALAYNRLYRSSALEQEALGGPVVKSLMKLLTWADERERNFVLLGAYLALVEQDGNLDAQRDYHLSGRGATAPQAAFDAIAHYRADHPKAPSLAAVDRVHQALLTYDATLLDSPGTFASAGAAALVLEAVSMYVEIGGAETWPSSDGSSLGDWILLGIIVALLAPFVLKHLQKFARKPSEETTHETS